MPIAYSKANIAQNLIFELCKRRSVCHAVTSHVETASLWHDKRLRLLWHCDSAALKAVLGQIPNFHCDPRHWVSLWHNFPYVLSTDLCKFVWAERTVLSLTWWKNCFPGKGQVVLILWTLWHLQTGLSVSQHPFILSVLPCYLCTSLLYKLVYQCDAVPWQCQKLFQLPLRGRKCYGTKAPFISQLMSCGLLHFTQQTLRGRTQGWGMGWKTEW